MPPAPQLRICVCGEACLSLQIAITYSLLQEGMDTHAECRGD